MDKNTIKKNTTKTNKTNKTNKTIDKIINEYIKKICEFDSLNKTFDEKLKNITVLTDNLIDYCIKKKILYYIENKISYTFRIIYRSPERTLTNEEINKIQEKIRKRTKEELGAELR